MLKSQKKYKTCNRQRPNKFEASKMRVKAARKSSKIAAVTIAKVKFAKIAVVVPRTAEKKMIVTDKVAVVPLSGIGVVGMSAFGMTVVGMCVVGMCASAVWMSVVGMSMVEMSVVGMSVVEMSVVGMSVVEMSVGGMTVVGMCASAVWVSVVGMSAIVTEIVRVAVTKTAIAMPTVAVADFATAILAISHLVENTAEQIFVRVQQEMWFISFSKRHPTTCHINLNNSSLWCHNKNNNNNSCSHFVWGGGHVFLLGLLKELFGQML